MWLPRRQREAPPPAPPHRGGEESKLSSPPLHRHGEGVGGDEAGLRGSPWGLLGSFGILAVLAPGGTPEHPLFLSSRRWRGWERGLALISLAAVLVLTACYQQQMGNQPRYDPFEPSAL